MPLPIHVIVQTVLASVAVFKFISAVKLYRPKPLHYVQRPSYQYYHRIRKEARQVYDKRFPVDSKARESKTNSDTEEKAAPWYTFGLAEAKAKTAARRNTPIVSKPYLATIAPASREQQGWLALTGGTTLPHGKFTSDPTSVEGVDLKSDATSSTIWILVALGLCITISLSGFLCTRKSRNARHTVDMVSGKRAVADEDPDKSDSDTDTETERDAAPVAKRTPADDEPVEGPKTRLTIALPPTAFSHSSNSSTVASGSGVPRNPQSSSQPRR